MKLDRTSQGAAAFVAALDPRRLYRVQYPGVVVAQGGPDSFDFRPDDLRIPGVSGVPVRLPTPGVTITVDPAQRPRALLAFAGGDPSKPELHLWERAGLQQLDVSASVAVSIDAPVVNFGDATAAVGRVGDAVSSATSMATWISAVTVFVNGLAPGTLVPPSGFGTISAGSGKVNA